MLLAIAIMSATWLLLLIVPFVGFFGVRMYRWARNFMRRKRKLDAINKDYETLRSVRHDAVYHYGWASSRGDTKEADAHELHVMEIDRKLGVLKRKYEAIQAGTEEATGVDSILVDELDKDKDK